MKHSITVSRLVMRALFTAGVLSALLPISISSQDSGSTVIIDRANKLNITGVTKIAFARRRQNEPPYDIRQGTENLLKAMNDWTDVQTSLDQNLMLSDKRIIDFPFVIITADERFELNQTEISNLKGYLASGGFIFADSNDESRSGSRLKNMLEQVLPDARFEPLEKSHEIYKCFYEFDGLPQGRQVGQSTVSVNYNPSMRTYSYVMPEPDVLEGMFYRGQLVAVYYDKGYINKWSNVNNDAQLKMGVNLIIYALTKEGSLTTQNYR